MKLSINSQPISAQKNDNSHIKGALTLTVSAIILKILGFIYKIPLSLYLGDEGLGYFNTAYTIFSIFYLLCTAGVPKAITMLVTEAGERRRAGEERKIVKVALLFFLILSASVSIAFILFSDIISSVLGAEKARYTLISIAPSIVPIALSGALRGYLGAKLKLIHIAISQIIDGIGKLACGLILAYYAHTSGLGAQMISAYTIFGVTIGALAGLIYLWIACNFKKAKENIGQKETVSSGNIILKRILRISVPITLSSFVMSLCNMIDLGMIMRTLSSKGYSEELCASIYGNYTTLSVSMLNFVISLITPISIASLPAITGAFVNSDNDRANEVIKSSLRATAFLGAPMVLGIFIFSSDILSILFPSSNIELGAPLLSLLIPAGAILPIIMLVNSTLEASGKFYAPLLSMLVGSIMKILVGGIIMNTGENPIIGAPIGTVASYICALFISLLVLSKIKGIKAPILKTHIIPYLNAFISVYIGREIKDMKLYDLGEVASMLITILVCAIIYGALSLLSGVLKIKSSNSVKINKSIEHNSLKKTNNA